MKKFEAPKIEVTMFRLFEQEKVLTNWLSSDEGELQSLYDNNRAIEF